MTYDLEQPWKADDCEVCGNPTKVKECPCCGGLGEIALDVFGERVVDDWVEVPDRFEVCDVCAGDGYITVCYTCKARAKANEAIEKTLEGERRPRQ
jgi:DnaJ-class molecular chaperone